MRIGGKQFPLWLIVGVVVGIAVVAAIALGARDPGTPPQSSLPGSSEPAESATSTSTSESTTTKTGTAKTATASNGSEDGASDDPSGGSGDEDGSPTATTGYVVVKFWDDTQSSEVGDFEVAVGSSTWKPRAGRDSDVTKLGPIELGKTIDFFVYPDGTDGKKIVVSIVVTAEMSGKNTEAIHVELRDTQVRVLGNPVVNFQVVEARS